MESFERTLRREPSEPTEAMQNGIEFEREVYNAAAGMPRKPHKSWEQGIQAVASIITGAPVQVRLSRDIEVGGREFLLHGVLDALKAGVIYDVKFTTTSLTNGSASKGYNVGKYLDNTQHPVYFALAPEAYEFHYIVSDGIDLAAEVYHRKNARPVSEIIAEFMVSIEGMGLLPLYLEKWEAK